MPYVDAYAAVRTFLDGDGGHLFATLDAGLPVGTMKPGAVAWSRAASGLSPRHPYVPPVYVELVPRESPPPLMVGPGVEERQVVIEATAYVRRHDVSTGDDQLDLAYKVQQLLRFRYDGVAKYSIPGVNFLVVESEEVVFDDTSGSKEYLRTRTRLRFAYREPMEDDAP